MHNGMKQHGGAKNVDTTHQNQAPLPIFSSIFVVTRLLQYGQLTFAGNDKPFAL